MGPPRAESASATVNLETVPRDDRQSRGSGRGANRNGRDADSDELSHPSPDPRRSHFSDDSSSSSDDDWLGPRRADEIAVSNVLSSSGNAPSQADSSSRNIRSSSNRQPGAQDDGSARNGGPSSRPSDGGQDSAQGSQLRQESGPDRSRREGQDGEDDVQKQPAGQSETDQDMQDLISQARDITPLSSPLTGGPSGFSLDPGCDPLSSQIDMRRINVSPDGIGMNSDDEDDDHNDDDEDEDGDNGGDPGAMPVANLTTNDQTTIRQISTASAIARGEAARQALRAARRSIPGPSRLARVLARLRIRPLPPIGPARVPHPPGEQVQRAARSSRFNFSRILHPGARLAPEPEPVPVDRQTRRRRRRQRTSSTQQQQPAVRIPGTQQPDLITRVVHVLPLQAPAPAPGAAGQPRNRLRRVGRLPERPRSPTNDTQQTSRVSRRGPSATERSRPPPIAGQPRSSRIRHPGRLPDWRSPPLGSLQGIPYSNAVPGQPQSIPMIPAADNAAASFFSSSSYVNIEGSSLATNPAEVSEVAVGGSIPSDVIIPIGDSRHQARAYAGEAVMNPSVQGRPDTIWYTPSLDVPPVPGYFRSHWTSLLGVWRVVYFYRVGSDGANAVLTTRLQNPIQGNAEG